MQKARITKAIAEAKRFIALAEDLIEDEKTAQRWDHVDHRYKPRWPDGRVAGSATVQGGTRASGALRRASQDLSDALIEMRKP